MTKYIIAFFFQIVFTLLLFYVSKNHFYLKLDLNSYFIGVFSITSYHFIILIAKQKAPTK